MPRPLCVEAAEAAALAAEACSTRLANTLPPHSCTYRVSRTVGALGRRSPRRAVLSAWAVRSFDGAHKVTPRGEERARSSMASTIPT